MKRYPPISHVLTKASHWSIEKQREYLILAAQCEKGKRRTKIHQALFTITTEILQKQNRGHHDRS